jgi:hypothetical protein
MALHEHKYSESVRKMVKKNVFIAHRRARAPKSYIYILEGSSIQPQSYDRSGEESGTERV